MPPCLGCNSLCFTHGTFNNVKPRWICCFRLLLGWLCSPTLFSNAAEAHVALAAQIREKQEAAKPVIRQLEQDVAKAKQAQEACAPGLREAKRLSFPCHLGMGQN